jgi:hypothetical protein
MEHWGLKHGSGKERQVNMPQLKVGDNVNRHSVIIRIWYDLIQCKTNVIIKIVKNILRV